MAEMTIPVLPQHSKIIWGTINYVLGQTQQDQLHNYIQSQYSGYYNANVESPLTTIYKNPHIAGKTVLTICDALFGGGWTHNPLDTWTVLGGAGEQPVFRDRCSSAGLHHRRYCSFRTE